MEEMVGAAEDRRRDGDVSLPQRLPYNLMMTQWASQLDPLVANPIMQGLAINGIDLVANTPLVIPILLNRVQQGWFITDKDATGDVWRTQPFNSQNMTLESDADTTISIWVF